MSNRRIILPKTASDLANKERIKDALRAIRLVNSLQRLRFVINSTGIVSESVIRLSERSALLTGEVSLSGTPRVLMAGAGGGGGCGRAGGAYTGCGGGGGAGDFMEFEYGLFEINTQYVVEIGQMGHGSSSSITGGTSGTGDTIFLGLHCKPGGGGGAGSELGAGSSGLPGASGGGGGGKNGGSLGGSATGNGYTGGVGLEGGTHNVGGGGGGFRSAGLPGTPNIAGGLGGHGVFSDISGTLREYCRGGNSRAISGGGLDGFYGCGGEGGVRYSGNGGAGCVIIAYGGSPRATGGTIKFEDNRTVHTFTRTGNFRFLS